MRLIDADALMKELEELRDIYRSERDDDAESAANDMWWIVKRFPTLDVRPVVHSGWRMNDNGTYTCKRCGSWIPNEQHFYAEYCLYCGAVMDDKEQN